MECAKCKCNIEYKSPKQRVILVYGCKGLKINQIVICKECYESTFEFLDNLYEYLPIKKGELL